MTRLAVIGDIHARFEYLDPVLDRIRKRGVDGVLLVGDLGSHHLGQQRQRTPARDARYLASIDQLFRRLNMLALPVAWVPGNHDLPDLQGDGNIDDATATIGDLRVAGVGGAGPDIFGFCYEWSEDEIRARTIAPCDVLLTHCPPARTPLDQVRGRHVGSEAIRELAENHTGFLVCGHIHESSGAVQIGNCLCMNVGGLGLPYGRPQVGFIERNDDGDVATHVDLRSGETREWRRT
jgi:Icc-related predicted phosphoesterase